MNQCAEICENAPITRRKTPHNRCAKADYFTIMLNYQFMVVPARGSLQALAFFDRSPLEGKKVRPYHIRCFESAAEHQYMTSA